MSMRVRSLVVRVASLAGAAASAVGASICSCASSIAPSSSPFGSAPVRLQRSIRTIHLSGIRTLRLRIAGRIGARSIWCTTILALRHGAEFISACRRRALLLRRLNSGASAWSPIRMEPLMISACAATNATVLHRVYGVATRMRVRVRRRGARRLEAEVWGHHRPRRERNILLARA